MVVGAFVLARLLGIRLLTLEARVIVHEHDRGGTGPGQLVLAPVPPDLPGPTRRPGSASAGSERLARAVRLVEQGADTLERTRRAQYRD
jgi:hypothetical protein